MEVRDPLLTIREVAKELRCSPAHTYNLINGKVRGVTPMPVLSAGRRLTVRRSSFEQWKCENERPRASAMIDPSLKNHP